MGWHSECMGSHTGGGVGRHSISEMIAAVKNTPCGVSGWGEWWDGGKLWERGGTK